jgi:polyhydroxyalkanoate synthase
VINRFYILDLTAEKSFGKRCVRLADYRVRRAEVRRQFDERCRVDDYIAAQVDAIDTNCAALKVDDPRYRLLRRRHICGNAGKSWPRAEKRTKVRSATFFTAQVDFSSGGELLNFTDDNH